MLFSSQIIRCAFADSPTLLLSNHPPTLSTSAPQPLSPPYVIPDQTNNVIPTQTKNVIPDQTKIVIQDKPNVIPDLDPGSNIQANKKTLDTGSRLKAASGMTKSMSFQPQSPSEQTTNPNVIPEKTKNVIPTQTKNVIPDKSNNVIPTQTKNVIPDKTNNVIPDSIRDPAIQSNPQHLSSSAPQPLSPSALLLHGYGGRKEDMLSIALALHQEGIDCIIPDLPGHGENKSTFNIENVRALIKEIDQTINSSIKVLLVGHSIGSVIALNTQASHVIALSPPGAGFFEGGNKELLKILRARRVIETAPYQGLQESISELSTSRINADCLLLYAKNELRSVMDYVATLEKEYAFKSKQIRDANHLDIITSSEAIESVKEYAKQYLL